MSQPIKFPPGGQDPSSGELRVILEACRFDLDRLRKNMAHDSSRHTGQASRAEQARLERRLCRMIARLEHMANTLGQALNHAAVQPHPTAAAEALTHRADHHIRNRLQAVTALLERQALRAETDAVREALDLAVTRMETMAQVHARLHALSTHYGIAPQLDLGIYLGRLCAALGRSVKGSTQHSRRQPQSSMG